MGVAVGGVWSPQATDRIMTAIPAAIQLLDISNIPLLSKMAISSVPQSRRVVYQIGTLRLSSGRRMRTNLTIHAAP